MIYPMNTNEATPITKSIIDAIEGFNVAAQLLNEDEIETKLSKMNVCQSIIGTINKNLHFKINIKNNTDEAEFIIRCEGPYEDIILIENKLKSNQIETELLIDNQSRPLVGRFNLFFDVSDIEGIANVVEALSRTEKLEEVQT